MCEYGFPAGRYRLRRGLLLATLAALPAEAVPPSVAELEARVASLARQLQEANAQLAEAQARADAAATAQAGTGDAADRGIRLGPVTLGGAVRANYIYGDYVAAGEAPQRGDNGGNVELDTFRVNVALDYRQWIGKLEYRWYDGYNFLHTGWLGYAFDDSSELQAGVTRVPFGPGAYGVSQSWFFDQHYYVGLADDMDLGVKYLTNPGNWQLALAYFASSEGNWHGASDDSARYSYDPVRWQSSIAPDGEVVDAPANGYRERNQFNLQAIHRFGTLAIPTDLGVSLQWGGLDGKRADNGNHWAASAHMVNTRGAATLATQLTRYEFDVDHGSSGDDALVVLGAYDFAWPAAASAWIPAVSLSYRIDTPGLPWLDYLLPYLEYSNIAKEEGGFNDSELWTLGSAWASGGWYIYSDLAYSNGNLFVGNEGDDYGNIYRGVGDFGANGNDAWNYRLNLNLGYYY